MFDDFKKWTANVHLLNYYDLLPTHLLFYYGHGNLGKNYDQKTKRL